MYKTCPFLIALLLSFQADAQFDCSNGRYFDDVFSDVELTEDVFFGENDQPTQNDPNARQTLYFNFYEPSGDTIERRPLIILGFGGAFVFGNKLSPDIVDISEKMAKKGYAMAAIDYRLTTELVQTPSRELAMTAVMKAYHDMKAAIRFFRNDALTANNYRIDPEQIYAGGVSAGAVAALHVAYLNEEVEVPYEYLTDTTGLGGIEGHSGTPGVSSHVAGVINLSGALSDTAYLQSGDVPLVSLHGTNDGIVPYGSDTLRTLDINLPMDGSESIHDRAIEKNVKSVFYSFKGAEHTPFILDDDAPQYMDTTMGVITVFMHEEVCGISSDLGAGAEKMQVMKVFPNPSNGAIQIQLPIALPHDAKVILHDLNGANAKVYRMLAGQTSLDLKGLDSGLKVIRIGDYEPIKLLVE